MVFYVYFVGLAIAWAATGNKWIALLFAAIVVLLLVTDKSRYEDYVARMQAKEAKGNVEKEDKWWLK